MTPRFLMRPLLNGGTLGGQMVERDSNLLRWRKLSLASAAAIAALLAYFGWRHHFSWVEFVLIQLIPMPMMVQAVLELTGWASASRIQRTRRLIQASPAGTVCWTRRRAAVYLAICGVLGFAVGLGCLSYTSHDIALGLAAGAIATIGYFLVVIGVNTYVLTVSAGRLSVVYRPLPHPFGTVDANISGSWSVDADTRWRRGGLVEYTLKLSFNDRPKGRQPIKLGIVDSYEEVQLLRSRIAELIEADGNAAALP